MGWIDNDLNAFAGWAGDLVTLAGDTQTYKNQYPDASVYQFVRDALSGNIDTTFSQSDLLADIDAVLLSNRIFNKPIYQTFTDYYSSDLYHGNGRPAVLKGEREGFAAWQVMAVGGQLFQVEAAERQVGAARGLAVLIHRNDPRSPSAGITEPSAAVMSSWA